MKIMLTFGSCLLLHVILCTLNRTMAVPVVLDDNFYDTSLNYKPSRADDYYVAYGKRLTDKNLNDLQRGYYYIDHGYISPVSTDADIRRQDIAKKPVRYTPIVRYRETKHKKLFVPNFFG